MMLLMMRSIIFSCCLLSTATAFQTHAPLLMTTTTTSSTVLLYRNDSSLVPEATTTSFENNDSTFLHGNNNNNNNEYVSLVQHQVHPPPQQNVPTLRTTARREVDRTNLHPLFKLAWLAPFHDKVPILAAAAVVTSPVWLPMLPILVVWRKALWAQSKAASQAVHQATFDQTTATYRAQQRALVDRLLLAQQQQQQGQQQQQQTLPPVIAVTMATGQEGQGVVRALVDAAIAQSSSSSSSSLHGNDEHAIVETIILALTRNPDSRAAQALQALSPTHVRLVQCDSTDATQLRQALQPAVAVYLCTTLNQAAAGQWNMPWNGGQYQVQQGRAFCQAAVGLKHLQHIVYGTAPLRKWPEAYAVEPPIHYAAKWKVEDLLRASNLPVTFLRKCPYHENFTKLTKAQEKPPTVTMSDNHGSTTTSSSVKMNGAAAMGVEAGGAFTAAVRRKIELAPGHYHIKAFTEDSFTYNMMDPRDAGQWAVLCFQNPKLLIGQSLSAASDALTGPEMAQAATECGALGEGVTFSYLQQPRWLFEALAFVEPTFVYISGLQRWNCDGGLYDLDAAGVEHVRQLVRGSTWCDHLEREGLGQFTETMADLLPDYAKRL